MAIDSTKKSSRLLQSRRYTLDTLTDGQEAFTRVLDLGSSEIYSQTDLIPTSSLPFSGSSQAGATSGVVKFWYRQKLTRGVESDGRQVWFFLETPAASADSQTLQSNQLTNFISPKYSIPSLAASNTEISTPGYLATVRTSTNGTTFSDPINTNNYAFDYKTGVLQFNSAAVTPSSGDVYISVYQYIGRTLADNDIQGYSGSFSGSFEGDGNGLTNIPASGIVGLNLTQIATSDTTASVSSGTTAFTLTRSGTPTFRINENGGFTALSDSAITGSLEISQNLTVQGTASINYLQSVTGSAKIIGDAFIILSADVPTSRFAGLKVIDSGSTGATGSLLYDSETDLWLYDSTAEGYASGFLVGPRSANIENLTFPSEFSVVRGDGEHHITQTNIFSTGSNVTINKGVTGSLAGLEILGDLEVTGSVRITAGASGSFSGSFQGTSTGTAVFPNFQATGSLSGSLKGSIDATGSFAGSIDATGTVSGSLSGSYEGSILSSNATITQLNATGSLSGSLDGVAILDQLTVEGTSSLTGPTNIEGATTITGLTTITGSEVVTSPLSSATTAPESTGNYTLLVSQSAWFYNHNAGVPRSNAWKTNLNGSYFNNFDHNTNVSEILRFVSGLLSASAPSPTPNTKTYSSLSENKSNTGTIANPTGLVPQSSTNSDIIYLTSKGWATPGSSIFNGLTIYNNPSYFLRYSSVSGGSTTISSSADTALFGLGALDDAVRVSGSISFRFEQANDTVATATSSSHQLIELLGAAPQNVGGVQKNIINTANPAVIPAAFQDGKFTNIFQSGLYNGGVSFSSISSSGYYEINATIGISSSLSTGYNNKAITERIFWSEVTDGDFAQNTISHQPTFTILTATSRSLSGAPYLQTATWNYQDTASGVFAPLYHEASPIFSLSDNSSLIEIGGTTSQVMSSGQISTTSLVYDSTGATQRSVGTVPHETDIIKTSNTITFNAGTSDNIGQSTTLSPTEFIITATAEDRDGSNIASGSTILYHEAGTFGQPSTSGSLGYYGQGQSYDGGTYTRSSAGSLITNFTGESTRLQIDDNVLSGSDANGTNWDTSFQLYNLTGKDLQIKPGYLVKPGSTNYGYWLTDPDPLETYKYYAVAFNRNLSTNQPNITMTLAGNTTLVNWTATTSNSVAALIIPESVLATVSNASGIDPTAAATSVIPSADGRNPFSRDLTVLANTNSQKTNPFVIDFPTSPNAFPLNTTYRNFVVLIRYIGDPTPLTSITLTVTA